MSQADSSPDAATLLAEWEVERNSLDGWLERLTEYSDQAPPHVVDQVRSDYLGRLKDLVRRASAHADELRESLGAVRDRLDVACDRRLELRLRYLVGEIDAAVLDAGLVEQEAVIAAVAEEQARLDVALPRFEAFVAELRARHPDLDLSSASEAGDQTVVGGAPAGDDLAFLHGLPVSPTSQEPVPVTPIVSEAPDSTPSITLATGAAAGQVTISAAVPRSHLVCRHCGTGNDPSLWYCDGCGGELA